MNETKMLIGSLSNDLFRVACLKQRGADKAAQKFLDEAKRWAKPLSQLNVKTYIQKIAAEIFQTKSENLSIEIAEKYLMYGILLQNYALHFD